ncbi:hypothetical protein [Cryptosporangium phraense]|uniref:PTS EIIC type-2 domain-containing protein n=1 Tax=Cryptosporangium phraense TaxID=2593070 RepID=A0A545AXA9_9ACTN|nr:hypothetical protein [Cryptosporangium phraense]TQS45973.1 hypothetical protein FL583_05630 [Cryptosporangium phraense]
MTILDTPAPTETRPPIRRALLVGVSYMIPFVATGGFLQALGLLLAGDAVTGPADDPAGSPVQHLGVLAFHLGTLAFGLLAPVLAAAVAYALAGRPGLVPGLTTGLAAATLGTGFLGGLLGGVLAGLAARLVTAAVERVRSPGWTRGPLAIVGTPLLTTLLAGGLMLGAVGPPLAVVTTALGRGLGSLGQTSAIGLGAVLGAMIASDLGGPINKIAYTYAAGALLGPAALTTPMTTAALSTPAAAAGPHLAVTTGALTAPTTAATGGPAAIAAGGTAGGAMAAVMAAGMCAPLALALATRLRPSLFTPAERRHAPAASALGALFVTEGAIPYAVADPARVLPAAVLGSATAGAVALGGHATLGVTHGGVLALFAAGHLLVFVTAVTVGTLVTAAAVLVAKGSKTVTRAKRVANHTGAAPQTPV